VRDGAVAEGVERVVLKFAFEAADLAFRIRVIKKSGSAATGL
jgi:hypothetical protein